MRSAARQQHGIACIHRMNRSRCTAQEDGAAGNEVELRPPLHQAEADAEWRSNLNPAIFYSEQPHSHEQFAHEIGRQAAALLL